MRYDRSPPRAGILYDRHHVPLVDNRPAFTLSLIPRELDEAEDRRSAVLGRVSTLLGIPYRSWSEPWRPAFPAISVGPGARAPRA